MKNNKIPESIDDLFTKRRVFMDGDKKIIKPFKPIVQNVNKEEIMYIHDLLVKKYGKVFTIDLVKSVPEEHFIHFRGTFDFDGYYGKGTIYFDSNTFDEIFNNLDRVLKKIEEKKITELIK